MNTTLTVTDELLRTSPIVESGKGWVIAKLPGSAGYLRQIEGESNRIFANLSAALDDCGALPWQD
jgi:hypothetical protein